METQNEIDENKETNSQAIIDKDKTFNSLIEIQSLLKEESSLRELCK